MPRVTARELVRFLRSQGFVEDRQSGSHRTLWHEGRQLSVTVPMHTGVDVGRGLAVRILRELVSLLTTFFACGDDRVATETETARRTHVRVAVQLS